MRASPPDANMMQHSYGEKGVVLLEMVEARRSELTELCGRYGVRRQSLFGSALRDDFDPGRSDLDLLVEFPPTSPQDHAEATSGCSRTWRACSGGAWISWSPGLSATPTSGGRSKSSKRPFMPRRSREAYLWAIVQDEVPRLLEKSETLLREGQ